jgi:EmrB/QacA subfamily drug resistance transporter
MMLMDFMGVSVALPEVRRALGGSFSEMQWVLEAFVLTLAAFVLTAGYVADLAGRRTIFLLGLAVLALGSLLGGLAPNAYVLIGGRVLQGMGGALLFSTGSILMSETFGSGRWRAALAVWGTVTGLAVAFSPLVGGAITDYLGWRWIFLIDVPTSAVALVVGAFSIRDKVPTGPEDATVLQPVHGPDWKGLALFTAAIAILVIGLVRTTTTLSGWAANGVLACFGCTALLLIAFIAVEAVSPAPMLDISLFRQRTFTGSSIAAFGLSAAVLGPFLFLVLYLSYDLGYSVMSVAVRLLLLSAMTLPFLPLTGALARLFPIKVLICGGLVLVAVGFWLMSRLTGTSTASQLIPGLLVAGVGLELVNPRLASAAVGAVKPRLAAVASRTSSTFRQIGTATGVAVFGAVLATRLTDDLNSALSSSTRLAGEGPQLTNLVLNGQIGLAASTPGAPAGLLGIIHHAFADSMHEVFLVAAIVALASAVLALSVRSRDVPRAPVRGARATSRRPALLAVPAPAAAVAEPSLPVPVVPEPALSEPALSEPALSEPVVPEPVVPEPVVPEPVVPEPVVPEPAPLEPVASEPIPSEPESSEPESSEPEMPEPEMPEPVPEVPLGPVAIGSGPLDDGAFDGGPSDAVMGEGLTEGTSFIGVYTEYGAPTEERTPVPRHVRGQVTGANGDPLAGASVALVHPNGDEVGHTYAAEDGSFHLDDVAAGTYTLVVAALHYRPAARVIVLSHGETLAMVSLLGVGSLVVRVARARDAMPLAAGIELFNGDGGLVAQSQAGDDGVSILPDLLEGNYELAVEREHYSPARGPVVVRRGRTGTAEVQLVGQGHLYGAVLDHDGGWLPATLVTLADESGTIVGVTRTDGAGAYLFPTVPEGLYTISAGHREAVLTVDIGAGTAAQADLVLAPPIPLEPPPAPVMTVPENGPDALSTKRDA